MYKVGCDICQKNDAPTTGVDAKLPDDWWGVTVTMGNYVVAEPVTARLHVCPECCKKLPASELELTEMFQTVLKMALQGPPTQEILPDAIQETTETTAPLPGIGQ